MNISWHGQKCFKITYQKGKGETSEILLSPFGKESGLRPLRLDSDIIISESAKKADIKEDSFLITGPGEYDIKGAYIHAFPVVGKQGFLTVIEAEEMRICHLGELGEKGLSSEQIEEIGDIDMLMIPVGDEKLLSVKDAINLMSEIEPKITIPMMYKIPGLKEKLEGAEAFLKTLGIKSPEPLPKLSIKKKDLPADEAKIIVLQA